MQITDVCIVGGGLAGLYAANQLEARNIKYQLFESAILCGGRVAGAPVTSATEELSVTTAKTSPAFYDLGSTWVFEHHRHMQALVDYMGLSLFPQHVSGDSLYQFENEKEPRRVATAQTAPSYRITHGAYSLIRALFNNLDAQNIYTQHTVTSVSKVAGKWRVRVRGNAKELEITCNHVMFALPPRIIARDFAKASWMNNILMQQLVNSQTWMSAQAKVVITYPLPFWREKGLSGQAFSQVGPLVEIHDACCSPNAGFALFGFVGIPATQRLRESQKELKRNCIKQLADIFGHDAYRFEKCFLKDWAKNKDICTGQDQSEGSRHPQINMQTCESALLGENLYLVGSEFAHSEAGYLEGALLAVNTAIKKMESKT